MSKKVVKSIKKKTKLSKTPISKVSSGGIENILIENFVSLQKVIVHLSSKLDNLAKQTSKLLELFEVSAKTLAQKELDLNKGESKKMVEKLDTLIEQNRIIARGLTLMHERIPGEKNPSMMPSNKPKPQEIGGYQKSISSNTPSRTPMNIPPKK